MVHKKETGNSLYIVIISITVILIAYFYALKLKFNDISTIIQEETSEKNVEEGFQSSRSYEQTRDFIINWCNKMEKNGVYKKSDVIRCVNLFDEIGSGTLPNQMAKPKTSNAFSYGMHGRRGDDSPTETIVSSDAERIYIYSNDGSYLTSSDVGKVRLFRSDKIPTGKEVEKEWTLVNLGGVYGIRSYCGNYLIVNEKDEITANQEEIDVWSKWQLKRVNGKYIIRASFWKKNLSIEGNMVSMSPDESEDQKWEIIKVPVAEDGIIKYFDNAQMTAEKNKLLGKLHEQVKNIINMNSKIKLNQKIKEKVIIAKNMALEEISKHIEKKNEERNKTIDVKKRRLRQRPYPLARNRAIINREITALEEQTINGFQKGVIISDMTKQRDLIIKRIATYIGLLEDQKNKFQTQLKENARVMSNWTEHKENEIKRMDLTIRDKEIKVADQIAKINEQQKRLTFLFDKIDKIDEKDEIVDANVKNTLDNYSSYKNRPLYIFLITVITLVFSILLLLRFYRNMNVIRM